MVTPTTTIAIGVTYAICSSVYFVTAAPTSQTRSTTTAMTNQRRLSFTPRSVDTLAEVLAANYRSGDDFVVEFLGHRFEFSSDDFAERVTAAAVRLELVGSNDLDSDEAGDLVELVADGRIVEPRSGLGIYLVRHWEHVSLVKQESLVYWLRKLVFRGAWLDHRVKEGLLDVSWEDDTGDFGYAEPKGGRTLLELAPRRNGSELEERPPALRLRVAEIAGVVLPRHVQQSFLDAVVEPGTPEDELAQPVHERLLLDERHVLPVPDEVDPEPAPRVHDPSVGDQLDEICRFVRVQVVGGDELEPHRRSRDTLREVVGAELEAMAEELDHEVVA